MMNDVIVFKVHIQENLEKYEDFVAEEVEREVEEQEASAQPNGVEQRGDEMEE